MVSGTRRGRAELETILCVVRFLEAFFGTSSLPPLTLSVYGGYNSQAPDNLRVGLFKMAHTKYKECAK
jgi:hypothetical protein